MTQFCTVERDGHLLVVTINRPEVRNALHRAATDELDQVWNAYEADPDLRVAILTGAGDKAFCAGYDVKESSAPPGRSFLATRHPRGIGGLALRFDGTKPIIAAVNGVAVGGGFELALACDLIVAAEHAEFGFPEPRIGRAAMDGGMHRLVRHVPLKMAMGMLMTGRRISAAEGWRIGLVNEVVPLAELMTAARRWARQILECAPLSVQGTKAAAMAALGLPLPVAVGLVPAALARALDADDQAEGVRAFLERREPRWSGR
jgi:crotonobetainyl-CoA hydratase